MLFLVFVKKLELVTIILIYWNKSCSFVKL